MAPESERPAPAPEVTLWDLLAEAAARAPDHPAIISPDSDDFHVTYASLRERAEAAAAALVGLGARAGEPLALWAANLLSWPVWFLGGVRMGALLVPILPSAPRAQVEHILRKTGATTLVMGPGRRGERIRLALEMMPALRTADRTALWDPSFPKLSRVIMHTDETPAGAYPASVLAERAEGLEEDEETTSGVLGRVLRRKLDEEQGAPPPPDAATAAALLFTAGTTGRLPLGIYASHHALLSAGREVAARLALGPTDQILLPVPFALYAGLSIGLVAAAAAGATVLPVFDPDPHRVLLDLAAASPTVFVATPRLLRSVMDAPEFSATARASVRAIVLVANPPPAGLLDAAAAAFPGAAVVQAYGLAEAGGLVAMGRVADRPEDRIARIGKLFPTLEGRVTEPDTGAPLGAGEVGELRLSGTTVAGAYFENAAASAAAYDGEGLLRTGDLVARDADGAVRFVGRLADRIPTPHGPVDPSEVEAFLATLDRTKVLEAWVVGVPGPAAEGAPASLIVAAVRLATGVTMSEAEILEQTARWLPPHKRPTRLFFVDEIPTGPSGGVLRHRLRELLAALLAPPPPRPKAEGDAGEAAEEPK